MPSEQVRNEFVFIVSRLETAKASKINGNSVENASKGFYF